MFWADGWCCFWWCHRMIQPWTQPFRAMPGSATPRIGSLQLVRSSGWIDRLSVFPIDEMLSYRLLCYFLNAQCHFQSILHVMYVYNSNYSRTIGHVIVNLIAMNMCTYLYGNHISAIIQLQLSTECICVCDYGDGILRIWCWEIIWFSEPASTEPTQNSPGNQSIIRFSTHSAPKSILDCQDRLTDQL